ncbi:hypothetical protein VCHC43B1_3700 [Vibrio cholerae HC-43B1]|nr:hypothetical protein VCHC43B1_3700 [Vibrio cholerae HC-43B1]
MKLLEFKCHKLAFEFLPDDYLVECVESSAVSEPLKNNKSRCFKGCWMLNMISLVSQMASSSLELCFLCRGLLIVVNAALIVLSFSSPLHSFWR